MWKIILSVIIGIVVLGLIGFTETANAEPFLSKIPSNPNLSNIIDLRVDSSGNMYGILDNNVVKINPSGDTLLTFGTSGSGDGQFSFPQDMAFDLAGNIYVADGNNNRIQKFNSTFTFLDKFGTNCVLSSGSGCVDPDGGGLLELGDGQFNSPEGIALDFSGNIYVADTNNHRIQKFDSAGAFQSKFGFLSSGDGNFFFPENIRIDDINQIFVADTANHRIQKFSSTCTIPISGDMIITSDCTLLSSDTTPANVIVQNGALMLIPSGTTLDINFATNNLTVQSGGGVLIQSGGKIT